MRPIWVIMPTARAWVDTVGLFPFRDYKPVGLNPNYTKESPANVAKITKALPTAEPLQTL